MKKKEEKPDRFVQGYACACATLADTWDRHLANMLLGEAGFTKQNLFEHECEPADIEKIFRKDESLVVIEADGE